MRKRGGFTLVEAMIVVAILAMLALIAVPNFMKIIADAKMKTCIANLRNIECAKELWIMENSAGLDSLPTWDDLVPVYLKYQPACSSGGTYSINKGGVLPTCTVTGHELT